MNKFKVLHTSDWHLGKKLFKAERIEEQRKFLMWTYDFLIKEQINLLIIAGDIFDVPSPPNNAQKLFYDFIYKIGSIPNFQSIVITGNHDSPTLFEIPKHFFREHNCHVYSRLEHDLAKLEHYIQHNDKLIGVKLLPYFRNYELVNFLPKECSDELNEEQIVSTYFQNFFDSWEKKPDYKFLVSHHGFGKYTAAGSEHAIFLSGIDHFPLSWIKNKFDYVALGHIHKKQVITKDPITVYPGSPIPLRFSEGNKKYISMVTIDENGLSQKDQELPVFKKLHQLKTNLENYQDDLKALVAGKEQQEEWFLEVLLNQDKTKSGVADQIRSIIKNKNIELISFIPQFSNPTEKNLSFEQLRELNLPELFSKYYKHKYQNKKVPDHIIKSFNQLLEEVKSENS